MNVSRRKVLSLLASTPVAAMVAAHAATEAMPYVPWSRSAAIYRVNVRQCSADGTLKAAQADQPRLVVNIGATAETFHLGAGERTLAAYDFLVETT